MFRGCLLRGFREGFLEALRQHRENGVGDGSSVATHVDGVHDGEGAANSEGEAEEEADQSEWKTHAIHDGTDGASGAVTGAGLP